MYGGSVGIVRAGKVPEFPTVTEVATISSVALTIGDDFDPLMEILLILQPEKVKTFAFRSMQIRKLGIVSASVYDVPEGVPPIAYCKKNAIEAGVKLRVICPEIVPAPSRVLSVVRERVPEIPSSFTIS